ncbi:MAG: DHH family phosphoesterase [Chloroflexota bacterium]
MNKAEFQPAVPLFQSAQRVLLASHIRPDGDAIGSLVGMGLALQEAGKQVQMVLADGVPSKLRFLPGSEQVRTRVKDAFDLFCVLDCSDMERVGEIVPAGTVPDVNIDHHRTNLNFARLNLVDVQAVSTTELVYGLLQALGWEPSLDVYSALLTGLITDTIGFRTSNMTAAALRLAAELVDAGADLPGLYQKALGSRSFQAARFWGAGLSGLQLEDRLVWTTLTLADRQAANYNGRDDADLVNLLSSIENADIAIIFVEQPDGRVKVSWRAQPGFDVSELALKFGGGGHAAAAGADIKGSLEEVQGLILAATRPLLDNTQREDLISQERG